MPITVLSDNGDMIRVYSNAKEEESQANRSSKSKY